MIYTAISGQGKDYELHFIPKETEIQGHVVSE